MRPGEHVPDLAHRLNLPPSVTRRAQRILLQGAMPSIRNPDVRATAAAAIYVAGLLAGERRSEAEVGRAAGVTLATLDRHLAGLATRMDADLIL